MRRDPSKRATTVAWVVLGSTAYATIRYNLLQGTPWVDWPTLVLNKALGFSSLLLLVIAVLRLRSPRQSSPSQALQAAGVLAALHVLLSLVLLTPAYYDKFFREGKFTAAAAWSMLLGSVAAVVMVTGAKRSEGQDPKRRILKLALLALVVGLHALLQASAAWFEPSRWPGAMPPITLLSFLASLAAVALALRPERTS